MVTRVRRPDSAPKLVSTWTGPRRIVTADKVHVYSVQNIVTGEVKDVDVVHLWFYADEDLEMPATLKKVFQYVFMQGGLEMAEIVDISEAKDGQGFGVKVNWIRFDEGESSWEPLDRGVRLSLQTFFGMTLSRIGTYFIVQFVWSICW